MDGMAAELVDPGFEGDSRRQARLLEDQGDRPIGKKLLGVSATSPELTFESDCPLEHDLIFVASQIRGADEVPTPQPGTRQLLACLKLHLRPSPDCRPQQEPPGPSGAGGSI